MKKLVLMFAAIAAISFASCGNKAAQAPAEDTDSVEVEMTDSVDVVDSTVVDSAAVDSVVAE